MQEILQSHPFRMTKILKCRVTNGTESNGSNQFSQIKETVKQGLGHLFTVSSQTVFISSLKPISSSISLIVHYRTTPVNRQSFIIFAVNAEAMICKEYKEYDGR